MKLSEKVKALLFAGVLAIVGIGATVMPSAYAANFNPGGGNAAIKQGTNDTNANTGANVDPQNMAKKVVGWLLWGVGIASVVVIIIGGILYTTSAGDQAKVTKAKNTILYGVVGLAIAILAYAIVNFVITQLTS